MPKPRIGELAVERALVSQEHLDLCVKIQQALHESHEHQGKRLGEILIEKGLLTTEDIEDLLDQQKELDAGTPPPAPAPPSDTPATATPSAARPAPRASGAAAARRPARLRRASIGAAVVLALVAAAMLLLRRAPAAQRTVSAYLESCRPGGGPPDRALAVGDLGLTVRSFRVTEALPAVTRDYSHELKSYAGHQGADTWEALLGAVPMPAAKRRALELAVPILPQGLTPRTAGSLAITEQTVRCAAHFRSKGKRLFAKGTLDVTAVQARTPHGASPWTVASYRKAAPQSGE